jgi:hypothetical protein
VTGALAGIRMFSGRDGIYLVSRYGPDGDVPAENLRHQIGIDSQEIRGLRLRHPMRATVTGRVETCGRRYARILAEPRGPDEIIVPSLGGYCHWFSGPTIQVDRYALSDQGYERLTGEAARSRYGNLSVIPDDWPLRERLEAFAREFLASLRSGYRASLANLHDEAENDAVVRSLLDDPNSVFAPFRRAPPSQTRIFVTARDHPARLDPNMVSGILCFCRAGDCSDRWPISAFDADNDPARPYACTIVQGQDWTARGARLETPIRGRGYLSEPARTALRADHDSTR